MEYKNNFSGKLQNIEL